MTLRILIITNEFSLGQASNVQQLDYNHFLNIFLYYLNPAYTHSILPVAQTWNFCVLSSGLRAILRVVSSGVTSSMSLLQTQKVSGAAADLLYWKTMTILSFSKVWIILGEEKANQQM